MTSQEHVSNLYTGSNPRTYIIIMASEQAPGILSQELTDSVYIASERRTSYM